MPTDSACNIQVAGDFYEFEKYVTFQRWSSFWHQIIATLRYKPTSVLEIGVGLGVTTEVLRRCGITVTTFDFDPSLKPDISGDVRKIRQLIAPRSVDMVCAFQILEHIPFNDFEEAVKGLAATAQNHVIISLPQWGRPFEFRARFFKNRFAIALGRRFYHRKPWAFDGQHYWEIGATGHEFEKVHALIVRHLDVLRHYVCSDNSYHYFFECAVRS